MRFRGRIWRLEDHIDTDAIIPARYLDTADPSELAAHCLEDHLPPFPKQVRQGDILVAGINFGCGSSREHAPRALQSSGIACIVAAGFARIFYRNAINIGLPIAICPAIVPSAEAGHRFDIDLDAGTVRNLDTDDVHSCEPFPPFMIQLIEAGGLVPYTRRQLEAERTPSS